MKAAAVAFDDVGRSVGSLPIIRQQPKQAFRAMGYPEVIWPLGSALAKFPIY
jgi:hypothetical protein